MSINFMKEDIYWLENKSQKVYEISTFFRDSSTTLKKFDADTTCHTFYLTNLRPNPSRLTLLPLTVGEISLQASQLLL